MGFLGPIGDDLPSLVPLVFALIIYFAAFNSSLSVFDKKNASFSEELESLKIARVLRSNGYIVDEENFSALCSLLNPSHTRFVAGIAEIGSTPEKAADPNENYDFYLDYSEPLQAQFLNDSGPGARCFEAGKKPDDASNGFFCCSNTGSFDLSSLESKAVSMRVYPIVLEKDRPGLGLVVSPMQLVVATWS